MNKKNNGKEITININQYIVLITLALIAISIPIYTGTNNMIAGYETPYGWEKQCVLDNRQQLNYTCDLQLPKIALIDGLNKTIYESMSITDVTYEQVIELVNSIQQGNVTCIPELNITCIKWGLFRDE